MKSNSRSVSARDYITSLAARGLHHFSSTEAQAALGISAEATKLALNRLAKQKLVASPARGFYVIVPPEFSSLGCLPPDQFIPNLMEFLDLSYYVGLLSAAEYHGAAHHRPQQFQVFLEKARRSLNCGAVRIAFIVCKRLKNVAVQSFNTPRGTILASTPEATALDLVGYQHHAGGLDQVTTVLSELSERIDSKKLVSAAQSVPIPWAQRLGYLLEHTGIMDKTSALKRYVREHARESTALLPSRPHERSQRDKGWKLYVNVEVEAEL